MRLLLVEDNPADVVLLKEALSECPLSIQLSTVRDGAQALAFLHHEGPYHTVPRPELIVLDLNLPRLQGQEVLAQVKRDAGLKHIPVVIFTSSRKPEDIVESYALGANACVQKPFELEDYFATIQELVGFWCRRALLS